MKGAKGEARIMARARGISSEEIHAKPITVIDFETTGLTPGLDRVIEVSVARIEPGERGQVVFDTLVNPMRPVAATEIHGITDKDVKNAPKFEEIVGDLMHWLSGSVVASYNVYFDIKFLSYELARAGVQAVPPHFCLMYMRPLLGLGSRCRLNEACKHHEIEITQGHVAGHDVQAATGLLEYYLATFHERGIRTYRDLAALKKYKFMKSFSNPFLPGPDRLKLSRSGATLSRYRSAPSSSSAQSTETRQAPKPLKEYWDALTVVLADLEIGFDELAHLQELEKSLGLEYEQIRCLHARAFTGALANFIDDEWLDDSEAATLRKLHSCLSTLGWAPGE